MLILIFSHQQYIYILGMSLQLDELSNFNVIQRKIENLFSIILSWNWDLVTRKMWLSDDLLYLFVKHLRSITFINNIENINLEKQRMMGKQKSARRLLILSYHHHWSLKLKQQTNVHSTTSVINSSKNDDISYHQVQRNYYSQYDEYIVIPCYVHDEYQVLKAFKNIAD
jgi:hypothetical protein